MHHAHVRGALCLVLCAVRATEMVKPCLTCGVLTSSGRCSRCRTMHNRMRKARDGRGSGGKATAFRTKVLAKSGGRCVVCGTTVGVEAHHIVPLRMGGTDDPRNGEARCVAHHPRGKG
jgi:5-methylcytosine-specific restriction endonuclease McrA